MGEWGGAVKAWLSMWFCREYVRNLEKGAGGRAVRGGDNLPECFRNPWMARCVVSVMGD